MEKRESDNEEEENAGRSEGETEEEKEKEAANSEGAAAASASVVDLSEEDFKRQRRMIMKNILLISLAFLCNFTAYGGLSRLQSSLHIDEGMGVITQSVLYGALMISCMFLPKLLINLIGHKWTITVSFSGYIVWMAANGYAVWETMIPASILVGLCAAPLWTAQCSYFTIIGTRYAKINGEPEDAVISRFFGIFFMFFQISSITGSVISSTILAPQPANPNDTKAPPADWTHCGADDCPWNNVTSTNIEEPSDTTLWTMVGVYIGVACLAILIVGIFVDNLPKELANRRPGVLKEVLDNLVATFRHLRHKEQLILIPLTMYSGFEQTFYSAEFTKSFVSCSLGIWKVGLVTLPYGFVNAAVSMTGGHVSKYIGRIPIFITGMCVDLCTQFTLMFWSPNPSEEYVLYILAAMWGFTDGIWQTQINTVYGVLFPSESEAAFSNYRMWESLGFIIAFAYSTYLCTSVKLYILTSLLCVGMIGYLIVEYLHRKKKRTDALYFESDYDKEGKSNHFENSSTDENSTKL